MGKKDHIIGVDIAKIIGMLFVVLIHTVPPIDRVDESNTILVIIKTVLWFIGTAGVDIFALATGFLCVNSKWDFRRILRLYGLVFFWNSTVFVLTIIFTRTAPSVADIGRICCPIFMGAYWYFTAYFLLFLFMPYLNAAVLNISRKHFEITLGLMFVFVCMLSVRGIDTFLMNKGMSPIWLICLYLAGAYYRLYGSKIKSCYLLAMALSTVVIAVSVKYLLSVLGCAHYCRYLATNISPLVVTFAISVFVCCTRVRFRDGMLSGKVIAVISSSVFGVYLIHAQPYFFVNVWWPRLGQVAFKSSFKYVCFVMCFTVVAFLICATMEMLRSKICKALKSSMANGFCKEYV